ncbi:MAG TPA: hypothetical protein VIG08_05725 [Gemmatimonadales bacterium]|jgi:hypothetical protein
MASGARFCPSCGQGVGQTAEAAASGTDRTPWIIAGTALLGLLAAVLVMISRSTPVATMAAEPAPTAEDGGGAPPDISNMSPRERFNRLYNRVMTAAQSGDEATVSRFTPMALMAYAQLDSVDADARYHAALLQVHTGDVTGPSALADTILSQHPGHLFGYVIRGTVARWQKDEKALSSAYSGFLAHYDAELKANRPEYGEHKTSIDEFHAAAEKAEKTEGTRKTEKS